MLNNEGSVYIELELESSGVGWWDLLCGGEIVGEGIELDCVMRHVTGPFKKLRSEVDQDDISK